MLNHVKTLNYVELQTILHHRNQARRDAIEGLVVIAGCLVAALFLTVL